MLSLQHTFTASMIAWDQKIARQKPSTRGAVLIHVKCGCDILRVLELKYFRSAKPDRAIHTAEASSPRATVHWSRLPAFDVANVSQDMSRDCSWFIQHGASRYSEIS